MANKQKIKEYAFIYLVVIFTFYASLFLVTQAKPSITGAVVADTKAEYSQEETQQASFTDNLLNLANKIGIPLKSEEVYDPLVFFQSYGFTLVISLFVLALSIYVVNNPSKLMSSGSQLISKTGINFRKLGRGHVLIKPHEKKSIREMLLEKKRKEAQKERESEERIKHRRELMLKAKKQTFGVFHSLGIVKTPEEKRKEEARKREQEEEKRQIQEEAKKKKVADYNQIKSQYRKLPKETSERIKLEVAVARKLLEEKDKFSVTDVLKKIDELYTGQLTRQERIDLYEDIKRWTSHGELCQKVGEENKVKYFKFV